MFHTLPRPCQANQSLLCIFRRLSGNAEAEPQREATTPRSTTLRGQPHSKATLLPCNPPGSGCGLPLPGHGKGYRGDMLALGSNLSLENETKATHQGHLGQGLEGSHGSGGAE